MVQRETTGRTAEAGGHSRPSGRVIDAARAAVPVIVLADRLAGPGGLRRVGRRWVGRCPLPDHPDKHPSFTVDPEKNLWNCFGCQRGGDSVRLACYAWGYAPRSREEQMAAAQLLHEFGHEQPGRPPTWYAKGARQREARAAFRTVRLAAARRRVYRLLLRDVAAMGETDPPESERELLWQAAGRVASLLVRDREDGEATAKASPGGAGKGTA